MRKPLLKEKTGEIDALIDAVIDNKIRLPRDAFVLLRTSSIVHLFTPRRIELLNVIKHEKPTSLNDLAEKVSRTKQAVSRDLRILRKYDLVLLQRDGRKTIPILKKELVLFPLGVPKKERGDSRESPISIDRPVLAVSTRHV